jgi:hypothetical protein
MNFFLQVPFKGSPVLYCFHYLVPISTTPLAIAAAVVDTGGNLPPVVLTPEATLPPVLLTNLPPVSTTPVVPVAKFSAEMSLIPVANLPPV